MKAKRLLLRYSVSRHAARRDPALSVGDFVAASAGGAAPLAAGWANAPGAKAPR